MSAVPKRRLSVRVARLLLAREIWARDHGWDGDDDYTSWDDDSLLSETYERYIAKADKAIREAMEREGVDGEEKR